MPSTQKKIPKSRPRGAKSARRPAAGDLAVVFVTPDGTTGTGIVKIKDARLDKRLDKSADEADRRKIAATFDVAAFDVISQTHAEQTDQEWSKPY